MPNEVKMVVFLKLFESSTTSILDNLAMECLQLDGSHTTSKRGATMSNGKGGKGLKQLIIQLFVIIKIIFSYFRLH
jgi:hypothetical protein